MTARPSDRPSRAPRGCLPIAAGDPVTRPLKTSESVARDIVHDIVARGLGSGAPLPHEAAMVEHYGVSRESLREALRLLEVQGLITIRRGPGGGPSVGQVTAANLGRTASLYYHLVGATHRELLEAWVHSESTLAELAARNPDRARVRAAMAPFLDDGSDPGPDDLAAYVRARTHVHAVIASLCDNRVLELSLQTAGQIVTHQFVEVADPRDVHDLLERDHAAIARAVHAGQPRRARQLMADHVHHIADYYVARLPDVDGLVEWR